MNKPLKYLSHYFKKARSSAHFNFILMTLLLVVEIELFTTWRSDVNLYARVLSFLAFNY
jgi:transposase